MGNNLFIVAPYPARPNTPWKVEIRAKFAGRRVRRFCESEAEAWSLGDDMVQKIREGGVSSLDVQADGMSMASATKSFIARQAAKSRSHRDKSAQICRMLGEKFKLVDVSPHDLDRWFSSLPGTETTRSMYFRYIRMFFRWAHRMDYVARDPSAVIDSPRASVGRNILTPDQMAAILKAQMPEWLMASILLGGFAGLRTEEMMRMEWGDIDAKAGEIHVRPGVMKDSGGFFERVVDFTEPLKRRAESLTGKGPLIPTTKRKLHYAREALAKSLGWPSWPDNCLRHSFATYHLARSRDPGKTGYQMGHSSPAMVRRVYAVPARRADGDAWWNL